MKLRRGCTWRREVMSRHHAQVASSTLQEGQTAAAGCTSISHAGQWDVRATAKSIAYGIVAPVDPDGRRALVADHQGLVRAIALKLKKQLSPVVEVDDLIA